MEPAYLGSFDNKDDLIKDFNLKYRELHDVDILFAIYEYENYSGTAFVLFEKNGKLYEVNASHCSCYGLKDQWEPEETSIEDIKYRLKQGTWGTKGYVNLFKRELKEYIERNWPDN